MHEEDRVNIKIFTDGSCNVQGGLKPGGFGVYCLSGEKEITLRRGFWNTTTSRMEMKALLTAIQMVDPNIFTNVEVISDSQFVVNSFKNGWISKWRVGGWTGVKNFEIWKEIVKEIDNRRKMKFKITWMNGHGKNLDDRLVFGNACADALADYKTQENFVQDKPLEGFSWFYHEELNCVFAEKTDKFYTLKGGCKNVILLGDCYYLEEKELLERLKDFSLLDRYFKGGIHADFKIEKI